MVINPIVGVYIPIIRIPVKRWDDHPQQNATFNHGSNEHPKTKKSRILPETNVAPENRPKPNRKVVFQPSICRGYVSFRECIHQVNFTNPQSFQKGGRMRLINFEVDEVKPPKSSILMEFSMK